MIKLPDAELRVMLSIWQSNEPLTSNSILENLNDKEWHIATLNKFLTRLLDRGFIEIAKSKRPKTYKSIISKESYKAFESKNLFFKLHKNSFKSLVASLYMEELSYDDIKEFEALLNSKRGKK